MYEIANDSKYFMEATSMALRTLRLEGDGILRKKSRHVKEINNRIKTLLDDMIDTLQENNGLGLAAPQVGILKRVVIIQISEEDDLLELINPEIIEFEGSQVNMEGCLSIPGERDYVERPEYVKVRALNRDGEEVIVEGEGILAIALCHELDHLDGVLYIDKTVEVDEDDMDDETGNESENEKGNESGD